MSDNKKEIKLAMQTYQQKVEDAQLLLGFAKDTPNTDTLEAALALLAAQLRSKVQRFPDMDIEEWMLWTKIITQLTNSQTKISKTRLAFGQTVQMAKEAIINELKASLREHPDLLQELIRLVQQTKVALPKGR